MRRLVIVVATVALASCAKAAPVRGVASPHAVAITSPSASATDGTIRLAGPPEEIFFEPPGDARPLLTYDEALAVAHADNPQLNLPPDAAGQLGFYTAAVGDGTYRWRHQLAWGIHFHQCVEWRGGISPSGPPDCTEWYFVDANTGSMLEATWQAGSGP